MFIRSVFRGLPFLLLALALRADTISANVSCTGFGDPPANHSTSNGSVGCSLANGLNSAIASASVSFADPSTPNGYYVASTAASMQLIQNTPPSSASASATIDLTLNTPGPVRTGYLELQFPMSPSFVNGTESDYFQNDSFSIGGVNGGCLSAPVGCYVLTGAPGQTLIPFTLGSSFTLDLNSSVAGVSPGYIDTEGAYQADLTVGFRFLEADGITPVLDGIGPATDPSSAAPEPATWALLLVAASALMLCMRAIRQRPVR